RRTRSRARSAASAPSRGRTNAPRAGSSSVIRERVDQTLGLATLPGVAFVEHFLEDAARALGIAHVDVRPREIELRADLGHRMRIERAADRALLHRLVDADVEIDRRRFVGSEDLGLEPRRARLLDRVTAGERAREIVEIEVEPAVAIGRGRRRIERLEHRRALSRDLALEHL